MVSPENKATLVIFAQFGRRGSRCIALSVCFIDFVDFVVQAKVPMWPAGKDGRLYFCRVPDPSEVFQTRRGGAVDPHTRLPGYTSSMMLGVTQVWFAIHPVGNVMKTLRMGRLDELHRRMKRNPHVLDAKVCRAVLWWNILGEAMDAAQEAEARRARRRENRRLVVALAVSQRREYRPMELSYFPTRMWSLPPQLAASESGRRFGAYVAYGFAGVREGRWAHLDEAAILSKVYAYL